VTSCGDLYFDADLRHETPEAMCLRSVALAREWGRDGSPVDAVIVEDNGTMGLLVGAMRVAARETGAVVPWQALTNADPKPLRIRSVSPYLHTRRVRVRDTPGGRLLVEQWREYPFASHDDGPDAAGVAIRRLEMLANWGN
jgi:hypothetical protein